MTTTKKKAKRTLAQRVTALECDAEELRNAGKNLDGRVGTFAVIITLMERREQGILTRVTELEAWQKGERMRGDHFAGRITALEQAHRPAEKPAKFDCGVMRDDCGCPDGTCALKPATSEEDRLRDAVVDAALAWGGPGWLGPGRMIEATAALRAHRAKKGGA